MRWSVSRNVAIHGPFRDVRAIPSRLGFGPRRTPSIGSQSVKPSAISHFRDGSEDQIRRIPTKHCPLLFPRHRIRSLADVDCVSGRIMRRKYGSFLFTRKGIWYFRYKPKFGKEICASLKTRSQKQAERLRDAQIRRLKNLEVDERLSRGILIDWIDSNNRIKKTIGDIVPEHMSRLSKKMKISALSDKYINEQSSVSKNHPEFLIQKQRVLTIMIKILGDRHIADITRSDFVDFVSTIKRLPPRVDPEQDLLPAKLGDPTISDKTAWNWVRITSSFFRWARDNDYIQAIPSQSVRVPKGARNPTPAPPPELLDDLCSLPALHIGSIDQEEWGILPWIYRFTGARLAEIAILIHDDLVMFKGTMCLRIPTQKTERGLNIDEVERRIVPISNKLKPKIDSFISRRGTGRLFRSIDRPHNIRGIPRPGYGKKFAQYYSKHSSRVWKPMHTHCWRSHATTCMEEKHIPDSYCRYIVGHKSQGVHEGYKDLSIARIDIELLKKAVDAIL